MAKKHRVPTPVSKLKYQDETQTTEEDPLEEEETSYFRLVLLGCGILGLLLVLFVAGVLIADVTGAFLFPAIGLGVVVGRGVVGV